MLGKPLLFLSSYTPLFALLAIRFEPQWLWTSCAALAVLGVVSLLLLLRLDDRSTTGPHVLTTIQDAGGEAASYLAGYLLPFLTVATPSVRDVIAYVGFLVVAATIHLRSSVAQVNPLLYLLGYHVLSVTDDRGLSAYMIARHVIPAGNEFLPLASVMTSLWTGPKRRSIGDRATTLDLLRSIAVIDRGA